MAALDRGSCLRRLWPGAAELAQICPCDEHAGLTAAQDEALKIGAAGELLHESLELSEHGLAQRIRAAARLVKRDQGDLAFQHFQTQ